MAGTVTPEIKSDTGTTAGVTGAAATGMRIAIGIGLAAMRSVTGTTAAPTTMAIGTIANAAGMGVGIIWTGTGAADRIMRKRGADPAPRFRMMR